MYSILHELPLTNQHVGKTVGVDEASPSNQDHVIPTFPSPPSCPCPCTTCSSSALSPSPFKIGHYQFETPPNYSTPNASVPCVDLTTGVVVSSQAYPLGRFMEVAHLLTTSLNGVHKITDVCMTSDRALVFRPVSYGDLHGYLRFHKVLTERVAAEYFRQMMIAIEEAHGNGLVLRDLKLKKFVFTDSNGSTLALSTLEDAVCMGKSINSDDLLDNRNACPAYVAPEMLQPGKYSGRAADMWSAGVILYTMLVGHYPFFDANPQLLFRKIRTGYFEFPHSMSLSVRSLIHSLLSYDPAQRPSAFAVSQHPWVRKPAMASDTLPSSSLPFSLGLRYRQLNEDQTVPIHKLL